MAGGLGAAAGLGGVIARLARGVSGRPPRSAALLLLRLEGVGSLVDRLGPDDAAAVCRRVQDRLIDDLGPGERLVARDGNEVAVALAAGPGSAVLLRAGRLRRDCEAPLLLRGGRVSLRVTGVLAQACARRRVADARLLTAAAAHLHGLPRSSRGALWIIDADNPAGGGTTARRSAPETSRPLASRATRPAPRCGETAAALDSAHDSAACLAKALHGGGIEIWFLPTFCCATGATLGFDLRPRWRHPHLGLSGTGAFLRGLSAPDRAELTRQVLRGAAEALRTWTAQGYRRASLAFAIGAAELTDRNFAELLLWEAERADIPPARFELSLGEDSLPPAAPGAAAAAAIADNLARLRAAGVTLTLSGFGSGVMAADQLRALGIGGVALDRHLLRGKRTGEAQPMLVSLLALGRRADLAVTAEGVASIEALALLSRLGCDRARGPGLGRTLPLAEAGAQLGRSIPLWEALHRGSAMPLPAARLPGRLGKSA